MTGVDRMGGGGAADVNAAQATLRFFGSGTVIAIDGADGSEATAIAETVTTTAEDTTTTTSDTTTDSASSATASSVATTTDTSSNGS